MTTLKKWGIVSGVICFTVFIIPWLWSLVYALVTDPSGFNMESIIGTISGIIVFALVAAFFGFSIAKKSFYLIVISSVCVVAIPIWWYFMPWLP
jgi:hypothetical protein